MKVTYTREYEVSCNIDDAVNTYNSIRRWYPKMSPEMALYDAVTHNLWYEDEEAEDTMTAPDEVIEKFMKVVNNRISEQIKMEGV